ncbi:MAG TPA: hypothetical protein VKV39_20115 [Candidatus Sulfotelmatobacter sp.]|nr:hypothetical protein [Candidatus Sulfotelmatobacter sp.]
MKYLFCLVIIVATVAFLAAGMFQNGNSPGTVGIAAGSPLPGLAARPDSPDRALTIFLRDLQRRNWDQAFTLLSKATGVREDELIEGWSGSSGSLRTFSGLESFDLWPLHATDESAQIRARLHWSTPVGPIEDLRDFQLKHEGGTWMVVWPKVTPSATPAQVVPVTYLRWDLVTGGAQDAWGSHNVDAPHVRIVSMNAVDSASGAVVLGEVVNEDAVPAFVNVNATLLDVSGKALDEESSFDRIAHILLPKQVSPYRIDFPGIRLQDVKNVQMDVRPTLVPASADPVIGVINQKMEKDAQGNPVLRGELVNQSGETVNIPHVIASFYDGNGRVIWVSDGYVEQALVPLGSEAFAVQVPRALATKVQNFHVVVNQYSLGKA